jgi:cyclophilin family peptidyl-prolyl cis-trans isomerase
MRQIAAYLLLAGLCVGAAGEKHRSDPQPSGPTVVIDTTMGRVTCKLYSNEAPVTVARFIGLAQGTVDWTDPATKTVIHGKSFYDGVAIAGAAGAMVSGDRLGAKKGVAGPPVELEKNGLKYDRAGRLFMSAVPAAKDDKKQQKMESSSIFFVSDHADNEFERWSGATIFGQCDDASIPVVEAISHKLLTVDNHPAVPVAINHISVVVDGQPLPPVASDVALNTVVPQPTPMPVSTMPSPEPTGPVAKIETSMGTMTCRLFKETPTGTANFIGLATGTKDWQMPSSDKVMHGKRLYDGLSFARVIPDFMIQNADDPGPRNGDGNIGFHFQNEIVPGLTFDRPGRLAYANAGPDTNTSEFFVTEHPMHRLDGNFTIFGQCDDAAVKLVEAIARVPRDADNKPLTPVVIRTISIVPTL